MRLVYATDLHDDPDAYAALAALARRERAHAVLLGGDLFAYSREAAPQLAFAAGPFRDFLRRLRAARTPVVAIPGNDDRVAAVAYLHTLAAAGLLRLADLRPQQLAPDDGTGAVSVVGYPFVPPTPFRLKEGERRDLAADRYTGPRPFFVSAPDPGAPWVAAPPDRLDRLPSIAEELAAAPVAAAPWVLLAHSPPWGVLDRSAPGSSRGGRPWRCTATSTRRRTCSGAGRSASGGRRCRRSSATRRRCRAACATPRGHPVTPPASGGRARCQRDRGGDYSVRSQVVGSAVSGAQRGSGRHRSHPSQYGDARRVTAAMARLSLSTR